jgi:hypothetical protein
LAFVKARSPLARAPLAFSFRDVLSGVHFLATSDRDRSDKSAFVVPDAAAALEEDAFLKKSTHLPMTGRPLAGQ